MNKEELRKILHQAKKASLVLARLSLQKRNRILKELAITLKKNQKLITQANHRDLFLLPKNYNLRDRLILDTKRIVAMTDDIEVLSNLDDPLNEILEEKTLDNGLRIKKITVPFGVIGVIYESRPNVTIDVVSLCLKSGNSVILKGGKEAYFTNQVLVGLVKKVLKKLDLPDDAVYNFDPNDLKLVGYLLKEKEYVDLIIPRGGAKLIDFVRNNSLVPVIETGAGVCHIYVDNEAKLAMAAKIVNNAKTSRPTVCNALDTVLVDKKIAGLFLKRLSIDLAVNEVEIYADEMSYKILKDLGYQHLKRASKADWGKEFLALKLAVKMVDGVNEAILHIGKYSTRHSEGIITENKDKAKVFLEQIDAACVYHNASIRFTDGSQFGLGGEIGISTQKLHARGPMGLKELTIYKWIILGTGQVRE